VCVSVCVFVSLSVCVCLSLSVCMSVYLYVSMCLSGSVCLQLKKLLVRTNAAEDYSVDPVVQEACQDVVRSACAHVQPGARRYPSAQLSL